MHRSKLLAALSAFALTLPLPAQEETNQTTRLGEVVVTSARLPQETVALDKYPAHVTVISQAQIAASPAFTLGELLRQQPGFTLLDSSGGFGTQRAPFGLRGYGEKSGTLVLVDGIRANDGGDGFFLWNSVPLSNIDRVEVIRGGASTIYGEGASGGVINIITKQGAAKPFSAVAESAAGNLGYFRSQIEVSGSTNVFSYLLNGHHQQWSGWRDNAGFESWNGLAKLSANTPAGRLGLAYTYHEEDSANPNQLTGVQFAANPRQSATPVFTFRDRLHRGELDYAKAFDESNWTLTAKLYATKYETMSDGFGPVSTLQPAYGGVLQATHEHEIFGRDNRLTFGGESVHQDFAQTGFGATTVHDSTLISGFLQDSYEVCSRLTLEAGLRFDHRRTFLNVPFAFPAFRGTKENNLWSPKVGLTLELAEKTSAWFSFSDAHRLPSANDVVSVSPAFPSSPALVPLKARTAEIGLRSERYSRLSGSLAYFHSWVQNDIFSDPAPPAFGGNVNGDVTRQGVELALNSRPAEWIELQASTAYTDAEHDGGTYDGNRLVLVPEWQLRGAVNLYPAEGWMFTLENLYVTGQQRFFDLGNVLAANQYNQLNAKLSYRWKNLTAFGSVNNLLDRVYEQFPTSNPFVPPISPSHNPAPGINFQLGASLRF